MTITNKAVSIATLLARLFIGWKFLDIVFQLIRSIDTSNALQLIGFFITLVGGTLLIIGLFTRWTSGILILYFVFLALAGYDLAVINANLTNIIILLITLLLGSGAYSIDHLRHRD